jgi:hypothetical protein
VQVATLDLEAERDYPWRSIESGRMGLLHRDRHDRCMVRATHATRDRVWEGEGLERLANGGQPGLAAHDHHRIILANVLSSDQRQPLGGRRCGGFTEGR